MDAIIEVVVYLFAELACWAIGKVGQPGASAQAQRDFGCLVLVGFAAVGVLACAALQLVSSQ